MKRNKILIIITLILLVLINLVNYSYADTPQISAGAALLMDASSGKILYEKNAQEKMYPASTTKIMTAILTLENCAVNDVVSVPYDALKIIPSGYAVAALQAGEELTIDQLLRVMMVHSANDAANVLAFHMAGSIDGFAIMMNQKIKELQLNHTHFTNPSGKHDANHYSTAHDMAMLMQYCMKNETFRSYAGLKSCTIPATNKYEERIFKTTNELLIVDTRNVASNYYYPYTIAGKTGYTTQAKNCLVSVSNKDGIELISVVLSVGVYSGNLSAKFLESKALFEYGYHTYALRKVREKDAIATQIEIGNGTKDTRNLDLILSRDITALVKQSDLENEILPEIKIHENLTAPITQGQVVGRITYTIDEISYTSDLIASHEVKKSNLLTFLFKILLILFILYLLYQLLFSNRGKKRKKTKKKKRKSNYIYSR